MLRDLLNRGKYPDAILPTCVLRRMDAVLKPTKTAVLETKEMRDQAGITEQRVTLASAAKQSFYNTSKFTLRDLKSRGSGFSVRTWSRKVMRPSVIWVYRETTPIGSRFLGAQSRRIVLPAGKLVTGSR